MTKAATVDKLNELHELLASTMMDQLKEDPTSALMSVARQFLKDANIEPSRDNKQMLQLRDSLPSFDDDEEDEEFVAPQPRTG